MEIEKKFEVVKIPSNLDQYPKKEIIQGYLCTNPVVRIRKSNENYILTYKNKKGISQENAIMNDEIEMMLNEDAFTHLMNKVDYNVIEKTRYLIPLKQGYIAELDIFHGKLEGLYFAEVEFPSEEEAIAFNKPDWLGVDISKDRRFGNSHLARLSSAKEL